jgi:hypothetical protein
VVESQNHARVCAGNPEPHFGQTLTSRKFMKPTTQISQNRKSRFSFTDYNYKSSADSTATASRKIAKLTGFHKLSSDFLGTEMARDYATEFSVFTFIALVSAWPIFLSIESIARLLGF